MEPQEDYQGREGIQPDVRPKLGVVQGGGESSEPRRGHLSSVAGGSSSAPITGNELRGREEKAARPAESKSSGELKDQEKEPNNPDIFGLNEDKLNKGYTGGKNERKSLTSRMYHGKSRFKQKIAIAGAATGGGILLSLIIFLALLPLKIEAIVHNLENKFSAASSQAIDTTTQNFYSSYVKKNVLPVLNRKGCKTTVSPDCVYGTAGKGAVGKLYAAWTQGRIEQKMARLGVVITSTGTGGGYHLNVSGHSYRIGADGDIFNLPGTTRASTNEVRTAVRSALKQSTLYDRSFYRFKLGKFLEAKYGIQRCVIACKARDDFKDWKSNKKQAYQAYLVERVINTKSPAYAIMFQCIIGTAGACPSSDPNNASNTPDANGDQTRTSQIQQTIQDNLAAYAARFATEEEGQAAIEKLIGNANDISKNGLGKYMTSRVLSKLFGTEITSEAVDKLGGPVSWIKTAANAVTNAAGIGKKAKEIDYAATSAQAAQLAGTLETVASEAEAGQADAAMIGSFSDAFSAADSAGHVSDATATPLYASFGGNSSLPQAASIFGSLFGTTTTSGNNTYKCDNGKPVASDKLVCPEEDLAAGSAAASDISDFVNSLPFLSGAASVVNEIESFPPATAITDLLSSVSDFVVRHIPGVSDVTDYAAKLLEPFTTLVVQKFMPSPITANMSGGRLYDMTAAGFDVTRNASCQIELGCAQVSDATAAKIQKTAFDEQQQEFQSRSMFARIFSTDTPQSLVSRLAVTMPSNLSSARNASIASMVTSPLSKISTVFSSLFSQQTTAFAGPPVSDPFHVAQTALVNLPSDPEAYWDSQCVNGPMGKYDESSDTLDISDWLNSNSGVDPNTGQSVILGDGNPCPAIHTVLQVGGAAFNPKLLPKGSTNSPATGTATTPPDGTTLSGDTASLAKQVLSDSKIVLGSGAKPDIVAASNNQQVTPGPIGGGGAGTTPCSARTPVLLNSTLLQAMIKISEKYTYQVNDVVSAHACDSGRHPLGRAMDLFCVDNPSYKPANPDPVCGSLEPFNGHWNDPYMLKFAADATQIMSDLMPDAVYPHVAGIGVCNQGDVPNIPKNINYFVDACDEIHIDVGRP